MIAKTRWWLGGGAVLLALVFGWWIRQSPHLEPTTNASVTGRSTYAQLYEVFWRADDGQSSTLLTATMFPPTLVSALDQAGEKTTTEQTITDVVHGATASQLGFFVTLDSVSGSVSDSTIQQSARVTINGQPLTVQSWRPIISASSVVNAPSGTASQRGLILAQASTPIDWATVTSVQLTLKGLPKTPTRVFTWSGAVLNQARP